MPEYLTELWEPQFKQHKRMRFMFRAESPYSNAVLTNPGQSFSLGNDKSLLWLEIRVLQKSRKQLPQFISRGTESPFAFFELSLSPFVLLPMMMIWRLEGNLPGPHLKEERWFNTALKGNNLISLFLIILAYFALPFFGEFDLSIVSRQCALIHTQTHTQTHL